MNQGILAELAPWSAKVEEALRAYLDHTTDLDGTRPPKRLLAAIEHALMAGGKRLRPLVCLAVAQALTNDGDDDGDGGDDNDGDNGGGAIALAMPSAVALELLHTYSLVHDDLPALDDDDLRRGKPTVHRAFDEAAAVLVGDALLTDAFGILSTSKHHVARQVRELAAAAGSGGMVAGQHDDLQNEGRGVSALSLEDLHEVHRKKTGRLFAAAAALGALAVGRDDVVNDARAYGAALGFAFQVQDDVLDVEGDVEKGGKARGRDEKHDKLTTVRALGLDGAKALAARAGVDAVTLAERLVEGGGSSRRLAALATFAVSRSH